MIHRYSETAEEYVKTIRPPVYTGHVDNNKKGQRVRGEKRRIVAVMRIAIRVIQARDTSDTKQNYDAAPLLRAAKDGAGKIPRPYIADGLGATSYDLQKSALYARGALRPSTYATSTCAEHRRREAPQRRDRLPPQTRPRYKRKDTDDIPHAITHQAARQHMWQDTCIGRWHRHT